MISPVAIPGRSPKILSRVSRFGRIDVTAYNDRIRVGVVGNKLDVVMANGLKREVHEQEAVAFARDNGMFF
jgi:hypothetical protein